MANYIRDILYVAQALPATNDDTGFEALTWVKVNGIQVLPKFAIAHNEIEVEDLESGFTKGEKGAAAGVGSPITVREVAADAGQEDLIEQADDSDGHLSCKIVRKPSGTGNTPASGDVVEYAQGFCHSYTPNDQNVSSHTGFTVTFRQNEQTVKATEPA